MLIRSFIAAPVPDDEAIKIMRYIRETGAVLRNRDYKWATRDQLHITLKFLGEQNPEIIERVKNALDEINFEPFEIAFNKLETFAGVVCLSCENKNMAVLAKNINAKVFEHAELEIDRRKFKTHITLARLKQRRFPTPDEMNLLLENPPEVKWTCGEIFLMKSKLTPEGAIYTRLY